MKKFLLLAVIFTSAPQCAHAFAGDIAPAAVTQVHDMQMLEEQRFRRDEVNDYKEIQEEKARFWKKNKTEAQRTQEAEQQVQQITEQVQRNQEQVAAPSRHSEFVRENGQLKIKYY